MGKSLQRRANLGVHIVRVSGHAGEPWWGVVCSHKYTLHGQSARDVVLARPRGSCPPERVTCYDRYIKEVNPRHLTRLFEHEVTLFLDKLVDVGTITRGERRHLMAIYRAALKPTTFKRKGVETIDARVGSRPGPPRVGHRLGAGQVALDWRLAHGHW